MTAHPNPDRELGERGVVISCDADPLCPQYRGLACAPGNPAPDDYLAELCRRYAEGHGWTYTPERGDLCPDHQPKPPPRAWATGVQAYGPNECQARCTCRWTGPPRATGEAADRDAMRHAIDPGEWHS